MTTTVRRTIGRQFARRRELLRYLLSLLERGGTIHALTIRRVPATLPQGQAEDATARRPKKRAGRPRRPRRKGETEADRQRRLARDRKAKQRAREKDKTS